ncbi:MAG: hypothetical protein A2Z72_06935 [Omnitrophica bacterium RBG_13_46_9]|nr:MAG: hypothetical protein A2Z72_06935 [Omnitrophica bacterium RBG_13_46_9]
MANQSYSYIWDKWLNAYESGNFSELDKESVETLLEARGFLRRNSVHSNEWREFNKYIDERKTDQKMKQIEKKQTEKENKAWIKWVIGIVAIPLVALLVNSAYMELSNRPYISIIYGGLKTIGHHKEANDDGTLYDDTSRKDIEVYAVIKNTGNSPANNVHIVRYLSYEGLEEPSPIGNWERSIMIPTNIPVIDRQPFMILNERLNNFVLDTKISYYRAKFLGLCYLGRSHIHYCKVRWNGMDFVVEESEDLR